MAIQKVGKGKSLKYRVQIRKKGFPALSKTFISEDNARQWHDEQIQLMESGSVSTVESTKHTVSDLIDKYVKAKSPPSAKIAHLKWWEERIGFMFLSAVNPQVIGEHLDKLAESNKTLGGTVIRKSTKRPSPATVNRYHSSLSSVFKYGLGRRVGWMKENPAHFEQMPESKGIVRYLDDEERESLLEQCQKSTWDGLYPLVLMALTTGARKGNLLNLRWRDLDLKAGVARFEDTKNGNSLSVPIMGQTLEVLKQRSKVRNIGSDLVFPAPTNPDKPYGNANLHWRRAVNAAELKAHFRFHDLRHTAGSYLAQANVNQAAIMAAMGHTTLEASQRYMHLSTEHIAEAQRKAFKGKGL